MLNMLDCPMFSLSRVQTVYPSHAHTCMLCSCYNDWLDWTLYARVDILKLSNVECEQSANCTILSVMSC